MYTYDPKQVAVIFNGSILDGFSDGTFLAVERNEEAFALKVGADGVGSRAKSNNKSARITFTVHQTAKVNDTLSNLAIADEKGNTGVGPFLIRDGSGRTVVTALQVWIVKIAPIELSHEITDRVWVLESDNVDIFVGGN